MPSELDVETIRKVARIARLELSPDEENELLADLREILAAFALLDEAKADCEPAFHPIEIKNYLRKDEPGLKIDPDQIIERMNLFHRYIRGPRMQ